MVCFHPIKMYWTKEYTDNGKKKLVPAEYWNVNRYGKFPDEPETEVRCNQCLGCRMNTARSNAVRIMDEASLFQNNCFITLTVGDRYIEDIFPGRSVCRRPFQLFAYRLYEKFKGFEFFPKPNFYKAKKWNPYPIRIVYCAEYGSLDWRPHFHAILMNFDFNDKQMYGTSDNGSSLYLSQDLMELWPYGRCDVGEVNADSAAYLAGYVLKKQRQIEYWIDEKYRLVSPEWDEECVYDTHWNSIPGESSFKVSSVIHHPAVYEKVPSVKQIIRPDTGELLNKPFVQYPAHFGVGRQWFQKYGHTDLYTDDKHVFGGKYYPVPRYYDKKMDEINTDYFQSVKDKRKERALEFKKSDEELQRLEQVFEYRQKRSEERKKI